VRRSTAAALVAGALASAPALASAEIVVHDADGWKVFITGRADSHYQLATGDGDPHNLNNKLVGGQFQNTSQDENNQIFDSRVRSGFLSTQIGFGVSDQFTPTLQGRAFVGIWLLGVDSHKGTPPDAKPVDAREGWGALDGPFGTFLFGRAFSIFGSASGVVNAYAYEFAVGNPCQLDVATIACGSVGAGPIYAGYNAQLRYASPRLAGLQLQASIEDPSSLPDYQITRYPRAEGELSYLLRLGLDGKLVFTGQGLVQQLSKINGTQNGTVSTNAWGGMGVARLEWRGLRVGGGAWTGKGIGTHVPFQQEDQGKPLAHDLPGGVDPAGNPLPGDQLRNFRGFFGNAAFDFRGSALAVGGGAANVQETLSDLLTPSTSLLRQNVEFHAVFTQRIYAVVLSAEYMHWRSTWYRGEVQTIDFVGAGSTFVW
jgi:predicted porin